MMHRPGRVPGRARRDARGRHDRDRRARHRACGNCGEDARGRILEPEFIETADSITVVFAVRTRGGAQECPSNPETPSIIELLTPLGDRLLLDGSSIPARDATTCPDQ